MTVSSVSSQHIYWDGFSYLSYILIRTCLDSVCLFGLFPNWLFVNCLVLPSGLFPSGVFRASTLIPVVVSPIFFALSAELVVIYLLFLGKFVWFSTPYSVDVKPNS